MRLINGTGAGIPLGLLNDPALISIAKDTGQASKTISFTNVMNMYNTLWAGSRPNQRVAVQPGNRAAALADGPAGRHQRRAGVSAAGVNNLYGAGASAPLSMLYGRPAYPMEQCPGLGNTGDLILVDLSQYIAATKGTILTAMSIHLKFDYDESVFRWIYRMDGQAPGPLRSRRTRPTIQDLQLRDRAGIPVIPDRLTVSISFHASETAGRQAGQPGPRIRTDRRRRP